MRALAAPRAVAESVMDEIAAVDNADDLLEVREVVVAVGQGGDVERVSRSRQPSSRRRRWWWCSVSVEDARLVVGVEQLGAADIDVDGADRNRAGRARERGHDGLGGVVGGSAGVHRQPVLTRERGRVGDAAQLRLQLGDFALDLAAIDAGLAGSDQLALDLVDHLDGAVDAGVGHVDRGGTEAESVLHGGHRRVVGAHGGGDRPVGGVVGSIGDADSRWRCGSAFRSAIYWCAVSDCSAVIAATLVLMLLICGTLER